MQLDQFDYDLPEPLIAQLPISQRTASRLLQVGQVDMGVAHQDLQFSQIVDLLNPGDVLVVNNTKVIAARMYGVKPTGGKVEVMLERVLDEYTALAQIKSNKPTKLGQIVHIGKELSIKVVSKEDGFYQLEFLGLSVVKALEQYGHLPLPPYIQRTADEFDEQRYQTVYASQAGAVAAPTAGLHFNQALIDQIQAKGVDFVELTLHVGAGTYQPVRANNITHHKMHSEHYSVSQPAIDAIMHAKATGGRVIAVGTTSVRALESAAQCNGLTSPTDGETDIFIYPGYEFKVVDALITNFHLPRSSLLMLVCAFGGYKRMMSAYQHAVAREYRFFSYGDAVFITKATDINPDNS